MGKIFSSAVKMKGGRFIVAKDSRTGKVISDVSEMARAEREEALVQETITTSDTKEFFTTAVNTFLLQEDAEADVQWRQLFREIQGTGSGQLLPFRDPSLAGEGSHGIRFEAVREGGEIQFSKVESKERYVKHIKYGTALPYSTEWFEDGELGLIEMATEDFRRAMQDKMAEIHYGIITDAVTSGVSKSAAVSGGTLNDFINDINDAVAIMWRNKFRPDWIVCAPEQEDIVLQALHDVFRDRSLTENAQRLRPLVTDYVAAGSVYLVKAQQRLVSTRRLDLQLATFQDLLRDSETLVGKFRRGAILLDGRCIRAITGL